jgi:hypothetical protein
MKNNKSKKSILILVLPLILITLIGCKKDEKINQSRAEITAVLLHKSCTEPLSEINGSYSDYDGEFIQRYRVELVDKDEFFLCYENDILLKIEIMGNIPNAKIVIEKETEKKVILENVDINGDYTIHHASIYYNGAISSGNLKIFSNDSIVKSIKMNIDGCH